MEQDRPTATPVGAAGPRTPERPAPLTLEHRRATARRERPAPLTMEDHEAWRISVLSEYFSQNELSRVSRMARAPLTSASASGPPSPTFVSAFSGIPTSNITPFLPGTVSRRSTAMDGLAVLPLPADSIHGLRNESDTAVSVRSYHENCLLTVLLEF